MIYIASSIIKPYSGKRMYFFYITVPIKQRKNTSLQVSKHNLLEESKVTIPFFERNLMTDVVKDKYF